MRNRLLTGALCFFLILASYAPRALAESPPQNDPVDGLAPPPTEPEPPCAPVDCQQIPVVIVACLDLVNGCDDDDDDETDFELCLNLNNEPCEEPDPEIDDVADPSTVPDPGGDDGDDEEPVEPSDPEPSDPDPVDPTPEPETPEPELPEPETPEPTPTDDPTEDPDPVTPGNGADIDAPRLGNPNFAG